MTSVKEIMLSLTGEEPFQAVGEELRYTCPYCGGVGANPGATNDHKFYINIKTGAWLDFQCGRKGNLTILAKDMRNTTYPEARRWLHSHRFEDPLVTRAKKVSPDLFTELSVLFSDNSNSVLSLDQLKMPNPPTNCHYLLDNINNPVALPYFRYCHKRGLSLQDIKRFHISYDEYGSYLKRDGTKGYVNDSIVFFTTYRDKPCYWNTRMIHLGQPKSLNAPALKGEFSRKEVVFNLDNLKKGQDVCLCEGVFNALTLNNKHVLGIATYGKNISPQQVRLITSQQDKIHSLYICLDSDAFYEQTKVYNQLRKAGFASPIYEVDDRELALSDWNDIGQDRSFKLINRKSFKPDFYSRLKKVL